VERAARIERARDREEWFSERRTSIAKKKSRTQMLFLLQLAGDWHSSVETATPHPHPHMMRVQILKENITTQSSNSVNCQKNSPGKYKLKMSRS